MKLAAALEADVTYYAEQTRRRWALRADGRDALVVLLQREVSQLWPDALCAVYGSCAVGLANEGSDVDIVVLHVPSDASYSAHQHQAACAQRLAQHLSTASWVQSIKTIDRSVTPLVSLVCVAPEGGFELSLDASFDAPGHHGLEALRLMQEQCAALPMLVPLVLLVKRLLDQRALKRAYSGGLSSYAVFIMAVRFLTDWRDAMRRRQHQEHGAPLSAGGGVLLGQAILGFLRFFGLEFDPERHGLSLRQGSGGYLNREHPTLERFRSDPLLVLDPLNPANNLCAHCYRVHEIQRALAEALATLEAAPLRAPPAGAPAGRHEWHVLHAVLPLEDG